MVGKQDNTPQLSIFDTPLEKFINLEHELCVLSQKIDWDSVEEEFSIYYSKIGRPSVPIRKMVGLILLKHIYNLSDESVVDRWIENPYWQYFSGERIFQTQKPFDPTEFIHFRNRIGKEGAEIISPSSPKKDATCYDKQKARKRFRARAGIEPVIGHIKHDHRMLRNYLRGVIGNQLNTILAGTGFNLKKMLNRIKEQILFVLFLVFNVCLRRSLVDNEFEKYGLFKG